LNGISYKWLNYEEVPDMSNAPEMPQHLVNLLAKRTLLNEDLTPLAIEYLTSLGIYDETYVPDEKEHLLDLQYDEKFIGVISEKYLKELLNMFPPSHWEMEQFCKEMVLSIKNIYGNVEMGFEVAKHYAKKSSTFDFDKFLEIYKEKNEKYGFSIIQRKCILFNVKQYYSISEKY
jgi:hypothetical protein